MPLRASGDNGTVALSHRDAGRPQDFRSIALRSLVDGHDGADDRPFEPVGAAIGSADNKSSYDGTAGTLNATVPLREILATYTRR